MKADCYEITCESTLTNEIFYVMADSFSGAERAAKIGIKGNVSRRALVNIKYLGDCYPDTDGGD